MGLHVAPVSAAVEHATLDGGTEAILITGEILPGDEEVFTQLSRRFPRATIYLESPGGALMASIEIGKLVRARRHATAVLDDSTCTSACALIWIAGAPRYLGQRGRLGFHASYTDEGNRMVETGVGNAMVGHYLSQLDLSEDATVFATIASPDQMNWLTAENSNEAEISYEIAPRSLPVPPRTVSTSSKLAGNPSRLQKAQATR
ncbi:MAG TPA: hypothetical protein VI168_08815 [Croceibacterium sp.]